MIYLSWDSEAVNRTLNVPPMYRVYKEYQKPQNEQNCELLKYRYDFLKTIVEAIKTVSTINIFRILKRSDPSNFIFEINVGKSRIRHRTTLNLHKVIFHRFVVDLEIQFQRRCMSDPTLSDIDFRNKMTWV